MKIYHYMRKKKLHSVFIHFLMLSLVCIINFYDTNAKLSTSVKETEVKRALKLNNTLEQELNHLDEINSILEYLAQAINKGAIKVENKARAHTWIQENKSIIRTLQKSHKLPLLESQLQHMLMATQLLAKHIHYAIVHKFKNLAQLELPILTTRSKLPITPQLLERTITENKELIAHLRDEANKAGLTTVNIITRKLDKLNDQYHVVQTLEQLPVIGLLAATGLYFTPKKYVNNIPVLRGIKQWLGTSQFDPDLPEECKKRKKDKNHTKENYERSGFFDYPIELCQSPDVQAAGVILTTVGAVAFSKEPIHPAIGSLRQQIRREWDKLKGFTVPNNTTSSIIEGITLDDERLIGIESQIEELRNLVRYITDPEIYDRSNSNLEKGVLLTGPSGNGKTYLARALCGHLNKYANEKGTAKYRFRELKWGEVKWSAEGIKTIIEQARKDAPCVLFIDEIHNLPLQTKEGGETLTEFLTGMSGVNSENDAKHQIILLAATNQPEMLDAALLRPGRFGTIIRFEKPNYINRKKYFDVILKHNAINTNEINLDSLARQTEGCSYSDLESIVKNARFIARTLAKGVAQEHFQERIDKLVHRLRNDLPPSDQEKRLISVHLAGHALLHVLLNTQEKLEFATIKGRWPKIKEARYWDARQREVYKAKVASYGVTLTYNNSEMLKLKDVKEKEKQCKVKLGGALAEKILLGSSGYTYHPKDKQKALAIAKEIILDGLQEADLPKSVQEKLSQDAYELLKKYEQETHAMLVTYKDTLTKVALELEQEATITAHTICAILTSDKSKIMHHCDIMQSSLPLAVSTI